MTAPARTETDWQRLDPRMLLVYPVNEVMKYIPVLLGSIIVGTTSGNPLWSLIPVTLVAALGIARWFTTSYRIDADHVQLRSGIVQRRTLSVPRSRIRSVDVEADLLHRVLGLAVLAIGTGKQTDKGEEFKLDALDTSQIPALRAELLAHTGQQTSGHSESAGAPHVAHHDALTESGVEIGHWQAAWVRYAPLSLTGLAVVAPIAGIGAQYGLIDVLSRSAVVQHLDDDTAMIVVIVITGLTVLTVLLVSLAGCAHYLATWFGLRVLDNGATLHLRHGLFTTRQITLDLARFRGATLNEPLLLRAANAAQLEMIMTGENPRQKILPQAPRAAVERTLDELLRTRRRPVATSLDKVASTAVLTDSPAPQPITGSALGTVELRRHGPAAHRRRYTHAAWPVGIVAVALAAIALAGWHPPAWTWSFPVVLAVVMALIAEDRYRGLGHRVLPGTTGPTWLITRSGSLDRNRDCLEAPGIIGWTVRQSFWQRRAGLATVVAATAAGKKSYLVVDIPIDQAADLIEAVTPGRLGKR
ncbi:PH domain-containing protein [Nocardia sp. XZ_19_231]|uniref:PH domain-containing protein n=1 Tax=Nocardia sp. XZ_19_231 TaxID=2769252 RepID=UPI00188E1193|nr:PH domain-containing protein [Nocardia sp. XZ_19_231]